MPEATELAVGSTQGFSRLMRFANPFDLLQLFPAEQSVAIVGNAPSVLQRPLGSYIDSHDVVVRFNECAVEGFEEQVGSRTDLLITNIYPENRRRKPADGCPIRLVLAIASQIRRGSMEVFENWVGDNLVLFTYSPDLIGVGESSHRSGLTTGTYGLQLIWRVLRPSRFFLTGFTMFESAEQSHYWAQGDQAARGSHDFSAESLIFCKLLNALRPKVEITSEVWTVFEREKIKPSSCISMLAD